MKKIRVGKVTLNCGTGKNQDKLVKALKLLKMISKREPVKCVTKKRIPVWGVRPGLPIGCKVTLRKKSAEELLKRLLEAVEFKLKPNCFDEHGNVNFGLKEYVDIAGMKYDPDIGVMGLQVCITLERPGFRVKKRRLIKRKVGKSHRIKREEAVEFMKKKFKVEVDTE